MDTILKDMVDIFKQKHMRKDSVMKKVVLVMTTLVFVSGCGALRFEPDEQQKQNAWLHHRTVSMAAGMAESEVVSNELKELTQLGEIQSRAIVADYGQPKVYPAAWSVEQVLSRGSFDLAEAALAQASKRGDTWELTDGLIEAGIGIAGLFGGAWAIGIVGFLRKVRIKSNALREIISGNELFKQANISMKEPFKIAHKQQSPQTRQIVAGLK